MNRFFLIVLIIFVFLFFIGCLSFAKKNPALLAEKLRWQLKNEKFEQIYDEASNDVHSNITKQEFIEKMKRLVSEMRTFDKELNWKNNYDLGYSSQVDHFDKSNFYSAFRELGEESSDITILMYWSDEEGEPEFYGLSAHSYKDGQKQFQISIP